MYLCIVSTPIQLQEKRRQQSKQQFSQPEPAKTTCSNTEKENGLPIQRAMRLYTCLFTGGNDDATAATATRLLHLLHLLHQAISCDVPSNNSKRARLDPSLPQILKYMAQAAPTVAAIPQTHGPAIGGVQPAL